MYYAKDFIDEKEGLIAKIENYHVFWTTIGTLHCIKVVNDKKTARFNILTGKQIITDSQYITIPAKILNSIQTLTKTKIMNGTYWTNIVLRINEANNDTSNYKVLSSTECPKLYCVKKPGRKPKYSKKK